MLKTRVIPTLLWKNVGLVKGAGFDSWRRVGAVLPAIKIYNLRDVDELILLDIDATPVGREPDYEFIEEFCLECFVPITIGGGVRTLEHVTRLLQSGADKVSLNTAIFETPELIDQAARRFGSQCVVVSIDARRSAAGGYECYSRAGSHPTGKPPVDWAREVERRGAGEILLTSVERDGTMKGYDLDLIREVSASVRTPVVASGGAGNYEHLLQAVRDAGASAVAAASMFHFTEQTPVEAKRSLAAAGIPVRRADADKRSGL